MIKTGRWNGLDYSREREEEEKKESIFLFIYYGVSVWRKSAVIEECHAITRELLRGIKCRDNEHGWPGGC